MSIGAAYDTIAEAYDDLCADAVRAPWVAAYAPFLGPGIRVLDVGCGTGTDSLIAADAGADVVGVDASEGMLNVARNRGTAARAHATFHCGDISAGWLPADAGTYDLLISGFAAFNTIGDPRAFPRLAASALRPGGRALLHFLTPGGLFDRVGHLTRGRIEQAFGGRSEVRRAVHVGASPVEHRLVRGDVAALDFGDDFEMESIRQIGAFIPDDGPSRVPRRLLPWLSRLDQRATAWPGVRLYGRFAILQLRRR